MKRIFATVVMGLMISQIGHADVRCTNAEGTRSITFLFQEYAFALSDSLQQVSTAGELLKVKGNPTLSLKGRTEDRFMYQYVVGSDLFVNVYYRSVATDLSPSVPPIIERIDVRNVGQEIERFTRCDRQ